MFIASCVYSNERRIHPMTPRLCAHFHTVCSAVGNVRDMSKSKRGNLFHFANNVVVSRHCLELVVCVIIRKYISRRLHKPHAVSLVRRYYFLREIIHSGNIVICFCCATAVHAFCFINAQFLFLCYQIIKQLHQS